MNRRSFLGALVALAGAPVLPLPRPWAAGGVLTTVPQMLPRGCDLQIRHAPSANRYVTLTGSNGPNPFISTCGEERVRIFSNGTVQWRRAA